MADTTGRARALTSTSPGSKAEEDTGRQSDVPKGDLDSPNPLSTPAITSSFTPDHVIHLLKQQSSDIEVHTALTYLNDGIQGKHGFNVRAPSAQASQIINGLVSNAVPNYWQPMIRISKFQQDIKRMILPCLTSVAGLGAVLAGLRGPTNEDIATTSRNCRGDLLLLLSSILQSDVTCTLLEAALISKEKRLPLWQQSVSLLAGSKVLAACATYLSDRILDLPRSTEVWLGQSEMYCKWLGSDISYAAINAPPTDEAFAMLAQMLTRALSLGHRGIFPPGSTVPARIP